MTRAHHARDTALGDRVAMTSIAATGLAVAAAVALSSGASAADPLQVTRRRGRRHGRGLRHTCRAQFTSRSGQASRSPSASDEPHSVTFGVGPEDVAPDPGR